MKYDAFISYSHGADGRLAPAVQGGLQRLAKPWYRRRALRVFRDETGLTVNPHLWSSIADSMDQSRYFVLLASPEAAASPWVNREIEHWLASHPVETLLPVLTDGTLEWSPEHGDFDPDRSTALPPALHGAFTEEPRHLDLRWAHDESQLDLRHSRFRAQIATLAAPIHGVAREDLEGEDVRMHRRAMRLAGAAVAALAALTVAAVIATFVAVGYAAEARRNERRAESNARQAARQETTATRNALLASRNAERAEEQESQAETNAALAAENETKAEAQQALAEANAAEAQQNAQQAAANGTRAEENARRATASAADASRNAAEAEAAAAQAARNADEAAHNAETATRNAEAAEEARQEAVAEAKRARREQRRADQQTEVALSRQLAAQSINDHGVAFDRALLEAIAAGDVAATTEARDSLERALMVEPMVRTHLHAAASPRVLAVSNRGRYVAAVLDQSRVEIWDTSTGTRRTLRIAQPVVGVEFGPDGQLVIAGDTSVRIVRRNGEQVGLPVPDDVSILAELAFDPSGDAVIAAVSAPPTATAPGATCGGERSCILRWTLAGAPRAPVSTLPTPGTGRVGSPTFGTDDRFAWIEESYPAGFDFCPTDAHCPLVVVVQDRGTGARAAHEIPHRQLAGRAVLSPDLSVVAFPEIPPGRGSPEGYRASWHEVATGELLRSFEFDPATGTATISPDADIALVDDRLVYWHEWDVMRFDFKDHPIATGAPFGAVAFSKSGEVLVTAKGNVVQVLELPAEDGPPHPATDFFVHGRKTVLPVFATELGMTHGPDDVVVDVSRDGRTAVVERIANLELVDTQTGRVLARTPRLPMTALEAIVSPDRRHVALWGFPDDQARVFHWDVDGASVTDLGLPIDGVRSWSISPDSARLAILATGLGCGRATVIALATGDEVVPQPPHRADGCERKVAYSDAGLLAIVTDRDVRLWDPVQGARTLVGSGDLDFYADVRVEFTPDGSRFALAAEGRATVWDVATRAVIWQGSARVPDAMTISADGSALVMASYVSGDEHYFTRIALTVLEQDGRAARTTRTVTFPAGNTVFAAGGSPELVLVPNRQTLVQYTLAGTLGTGERRFLRYRLDPSALRSYACRLANRDLNALEWTALTNDVVERVPCADRPRR